MQMHYKLKFTPLEFKTIAIALKCFKTRPLKFTPLEFKTVENIMFDRGLNC